MGTLIIGTLGVIGICVLALIIVVYEDKKK